MRAAFMTFALPLVVLSGAATTGSAATPDDGDAMRRLAAERGCTTCHDERPAFESKSILPPAPSWKQIAEKYRGVEGAQARLVPIVLNGSNPREPHWKNRAGFDRMLPNAEEIGPGEATALVRWILAAH